jgi:hypothetical protein
VSVKIDDRRQEERRHSASIDVRRFSAGAARILLTTILLVLSSHVALADTRFTASVDNTTIPMGEYLEITFTLDGSTGGSNLHAPSFQDFMVLSGPNQSTSMQIVNGSMSSSVSYSFVLQPRSEGKFTIGSASIESGGKKYQTQTITVQVTKGGAKPKSQVGVTAEEPDVAGQIGDNLFLKTFADKTRVYQGEQVTVTYRLYTRIQISNYDLTKMPAFTGFWSEDLISNRQQVELSTESFNGKEYRVATLKKVALFPQRSGNLQIDPMEIQTQIFISSRKRSDDIFDQFFNESRPINYKLHSEPLNLAVLPLPVENIPAGFHGAVGKFSINTSIDKQDLKTNDPFTLRIQIAGQGNLNLLQPPEIATPPDFEKFEPKVSSNITTHGEQITGSKTFEYLMIPRHAGDQTIPPVSYSYFDIEKKSYVTYRSPAFSIHVQRGLETGSTGVSSLNKEDVKLLGEDIHFIKSGSMRFSQKGNSFAGSPLFLFLSLSSPLAFAALIAVLRKREKRMGDIFAIRSRKAKRIARKRLGKAELFLKTGKNEEFFAEVARAMWGYLGDRLSIPPAELTQESVQTSLKLRGAGGQTIEQTIAAIEKCEFARFAPSSDPGKMDELLKTAIHLVSSIEEQIA